MRLVNFTRDGRATSTLVVFTADITFFFFDHLKILVICRARVSHTNMLHPFARMVRHFVLREELLHLAFILARTLRPSFGVRDLVNSVSIELARRLRSLHELALRRSETFLLLDLLKDLLAELLKDALRVARLNLTNQVVNPRAIHLNTTILKALLEL